MCWFLPYTSMNQPCFENWLLSIYQHTIHSVLSDWQSVACPLLSLYRVTPHFLSEKRRSREIFNRSVQQKSVNEAYWNIHSFVRISEISHVSGCSETLAKSRAVILRAAFVLRDHNQIVTIHSFLSASSLIPFVCRIILNSDKHVTFSWWKLDSFPWKY